MIGHDLRVNSLHGSALALALGLGGSLWAGMGAFLAAQNAMNQLWGVPYTRRPDFLRARARALLLLVVLGGGILATTVLAGLAAFGAGYGSAGRSARSRSRPRSTSVSSGSLFASSPPRTSRGGSSEGARSQPPSSTRCCRRSAATTSAT